jgi:YidC/Oxa1 family membrane protein insertase
MEKRVLLAVSLSFIVLVVYQALFVKPVPRRGANQERPAAAAPGNAARPAGGAGAPPGTEPQAARDEGEVASVPPAPAVVGDTEERDIIVESDEVRAVFSTRGAELRSWELKRFLNERRQPVNLVPRGVADGVPGAFSILAEDAPATTTRLRQALFKPSATRIDARRGARLVFEYQDAEGLAARKEFLFRAGGQPYVMDLTVQVTRGERPIPVAVASGPGIGDTERAGGSSSFFSPSYYQRPEAIYQQGSDVSRVPAEKLAASPVHEGRFRYIGMDDHYFLSVLLPGERDVRVVYETVDLGAPPGPHRLVAYRATAGGAVEGFRFYLGPKHFDTLAATDRELVRAIHFGIFAWLVVPLLRALNWINGFIGNYGWSIILLTLLINGAIAPLRHRSVVSMRKMQEIQPQVKAIQERYAKLKATDPQRQKMNAELMQLYREKGVNPASGCLPMLLTMPVLFAFYSMLSQAIELRGAPFMGWIHDLSSYDPYYVTPLLMGASMVWQQKLTPTTADPVQQKVMMFMPLMFTFLFLWAPSGLVIYWFVSNLWAIGQQYVTNRLIGPPKVVAGRPPAERRVKVAGAGKSEAGA